MQTGEIIHALIAGGIAALAYAGIGAAVDELSNRRSATPRTDAVTWLLIVLIVVITLLALGLSR